MNEKRVAYAARFVLLYNVLIPTPLAGVLFAKIAESTSGLSVSIPTPYTGGVF